MSLTISDAVHLYFERRGAIILKNCSSVYSKQHYLFYPSVLNMCEVHKVKAMLTLLFLNVPVRFCYFPSTPFDTKGKCDSLFYIYV